MYKIGTHTKVEVSTAKSKFIDNLRSVLEMCVFALMRDIQWKK